MNMMFWIGLISLSIVSCTSRTTDWRIKAANPECLHRSIKQVTDVIVHDIFSPPVAGRIYSYVTIAAYETARQGAADYLSLAGQVKDLPPTPVPEKGEEYCFELASVQAVLTVGQALVFSEDKMADFYNKILQEYQAMGDPKEVAELIVWLSSEKASFVTGSYYADDHLWQ